MEVYNLHPIEYVKIPNAKKKKTKSVKASSHRKRSDVESFIPAKAILSTDTARKMMMEYLQDRLGLRKKDSHRSTKIIIVLKSNEAVILILTKSPL